MTIIGEIGDQLALIAPFIYGVHCFTTPVLLTLMPSFQALRIASSESFHFWMMLAVIPTSLVTLVIGYKQHKNATFLGIGLFGLAILVFSALWGHQLLGCAYEKYLTMGGS